MLSSIRLQQLYAISCEQEQIHSYDRIWDSCCDHGYLGQALVESGLNSGLNSHIVFVDQHSHIIQSLQQRLKKVVNAETGDYSVLACDARHLKLSATQRHLFIVAGVGGKLVIDIVRQVLHNNPSAEIDLLLCPNNSLFLVRQQLRQLRLSLRQESIIVENNLAYEVLLLSHIKTEAQAVADTSSVSAVGKMWNLNNVEHKQYLNRLLKHYRNKLRSDASAKVAVQAYQKVLNDG